LDAAKLALVLLLAEEFTVVLCEAGTVKRTNLFDAVDGVTTEVGKCCCC
jgi:hypothetical protein